MKKTNHKLKRKEVNKMNMKATHIQTGEVRMCNTGNITGDYYNLDKRLWTFEKVEDEATSEEKEDPA